MSRRGKQVPNHSLQRYPTPQGPALCPGLVSRFRLWELVLRPGLALPHQLSISEGRMCHLTGSSFKEQEACERTGRI